MNKLLIFFIALFSCVCAFAQTSSSNIAKALESEFKGNVYMLRGFPIEGVIKFDANCQPITSIDSGSWTTADMQVDKIEAHGDDVVLIGKRSGFALLDAKSKTLERVNLKEGKGVDGDIKIRLTIAGPFSDSSADFVQKVKDRIFVLDANEMLKLVPSYWQKYFADWLKPKSPDAASPVVKPPAGELSAQKTSDGQDVYRVGKTVKPPRPLYSPDPEYTELARAAKFDGVSVVAVIVSPTGVLGDINIVRPLGMGLDEKAIAAIETWRFQPAMRGNEPVAVAVNIEVSFKVY